MNTAPPNKRRSLSNLGGEIDVAGDEEPARFLAEALRVESAAAPAEDRNDASDEDDSDRVHVHGFHSYPARMHPTTAARLVRSFSKEGDRVMDPFCGSGTVLVEAMLAGREATGTDLNPFAAMLARCKTRRRSVEEIAAIGDEARAAAKVADARRKAKAGPTRRLPDEDLELFEPHVAMELDGLRAAIIHVKNPRTRDDLRLVLSAILVKVSRKRGDTSTRVDTRRIAAGYTAKLFTKKAEELAKRLREFEEILPKNVKEAYVDVDDATVLKAIIPASIDAVITSPPYVATYDYLAHHALRMRWLELDAKKLDRGEMGSRRKYTTMSAADARKNWQHELELFLKAIGRATKPNAPVVLLMADSAVGGEALRADTMVATAAKNCGYVPVARASQVRPHFHGPTVAAFRKEPRREHALLIERG